MKNFLKKCLEIFQGKALATNKSYDRIKSRITSNSNE
jgi:hypothetical protein